MYMRHFVRLLIVMAMVMPIWVGVAQGVAVADVAPDCSGNTGTASFSNGGFPALQTPYPDIQARERNVVITATGTLSGCVGGGVTGGTYAATITTHDPSDCNELLSVGDAADANPDAPFPNGNIAITWNTTAVSTGTIKIEPVPGSPTTVTTKIHFTGGPFINRGGRQRIKFAPNGHGDCSSSDLQGVSLSAASSLDIS
jgi:hypothetical protein